MKFEVAVLYLRWKKKRLLLKESLCERVPVNISLLKLCSNPTLHHVQPLLYLKVLGTERKPFPAVLHIYHYCWQKGSGRAGNATSILRAALGTAGPALTDMVLLPLTRPHKRAAVVCVGNDPA